MFWGLKMKPGCRYESEVQEPFRITKACLAPSTSLEEEGLSSVTLQTNQDEQTFMIACLGHNNLSECIDVSFNQGQTVCFKVEGKGIVHLTGNVVQDVELSNDESSGSENESMESEEVNSEGEKIEEEQNTEDSGDDTVRKGKEEVKEKTKLPNEKKERTNNKPNKKEAHKPDSKVSKENVTKPNSNVTYAGMKVEDLVIGSGSECKKGNGIGMYYTGYLLKTGKVFDSLTSGKPLKFKLGHNQVIKGWDVGIQGMRVGGKRKLIIPASMGYGSQGAMRAGGSIPPNADLIFSVECKFVKVYGGDQDW